MRILQICHKPPFPSVDGGCIAINNITHGLIQKGHYVKVLSIHTDKHPIVSSPEFSDYSNKTGFESVYVDTSIHPINALKSLLLRKSYHVDRFVSKEFAQLITNTLKKNNFDIILMESIFVTPYISLIRNITKAKVVVRLHNIEHKVWERLIQNESSVWRRLVLKQMTKQLKNYECSFLNKADGFMTISEVDFSFFHSHYPGVKGVTIPFGLNVDDYENDDEYFPSDKPELFHIGSMNWLPNREGIAWFLEEVWPQITEKFKDVTFTLAGRDIPEEFQKYASSNLSIVGEVPDSKEFMLSKDIMIVPLLSGSGVRIKIIEGMALGKTIISTTIGVEGLEVTDGQNIFIADTAEEMVTVIEKCIKTPDLCVIIGENAESYVTLHHNNDIIIEKIIRFFESI